MRSRKSGRARLGQWLAALAALATAAVSSQALAAPLGPDYGTEFEVRGGIYGHGVPFTGPGFESGSADVNLEFLTPRPALWTDTRLSKLLPRLQIGGTINTAGKTSLVYAGAAWTFDFGGSPWFVEPNLGIAAHNGEFDAPPGGERLSLGCNPLFHTGLSGGYRLSRRWAVMATWEHASNGNLCSHNDGLNNVGARLSFSF
jgi:lipid A 3-O-deacylase